MAFLAGWRAKDYAQWMAVVGVGSLFIFAVLWLVGSAVAWLLVDAVVHP